ncbi:MAG TPA: pyridoxamine 5'-phosphate oxidase family protein [Gaiellaceae bacterium]|nr:pyridoxamine 5'-phosphate oxidase family protein [Gaiellaceae bacterium]
MSRSAGRPPIPGRSEYGRGTAAAVAWEDAEQRLRDARYYWLATTRPDGRPHTVPVWAVWERGLLLFATSPSTVTGRNLAHNPAVAAHPDGARDVVLVEGRAERLSGQDAASAAHAYEAKYGWRLDPTDAGMPFFALRPQVVLAWSAADVRGTAARWEW